MRAPLLNLVAAQPGATGAVRRAVLSASQLGTLARLSVLLLLLFCATLLIAPRAQQAQEPEKEQSPTRDGDARVAWQRPRFTDRQSERDQMVEQQITRASLFRKAVTDKRVLGAMRTVPRHLFVPAKQRRRAYSDTPLPIGHSQTISQPYIVAIMTELLDTKPKDKILEIGTGSGYQAAVLSELTPHVYTIELIKPLHEQAAQRFETLGYKTIRTRYADGYDGWAEHGPFDGIIVTCAAGHVPPPLWKQLKPGGRMVVPIGPVHQTQRLVVLTKQEDGSRRSRTILPVAFVPMTGKISNP